jgi:hypothetical protein
MKDLIKAPLALIFGLACISASYADTTTTTVVTTTAPAPVVVVQDGFTVKWAQVYVTRYGVEKVMQDSMKLRDGIVVRTDGTIIVPGGTRKVLHTGDWMTFGGMITRADSGRVEQLHPED